MAEKLQYTRNLYDRACRVMPGGNSRHTIFFAPFPPYAVSGKGCRVVDVEGVERIDFINNYSSLIHGHCEPHIVAAVKEQAERLFAIGLPTESEIELAELLCDRIPGVEQIRFANSGTEAVMYTVKAARANTGRAKIAKIEGTFHGGYDVSEISLASSPDNWGDAERPARVPLCTGTPAGISEDAIILPMNNIGASETLLRENADTIAGVIIDPVPSRIGYLPASVEYLRMLREVTRDIGALLIFDEVYSLRLGIGGVQGNLGFTPDLTALGKIIGGGLPVGAVGGRKDYMAVFMAESAALPKVIHGGTYNANPMTMAAGLTAMTLLTPQALAHVDYLGDRMRQGMRKKLDELGIGGQVRGQGSLISFRLGAQESVDYRSFTLDGHDAVWEGRLHAALLDRGILCTSNLLFILSTVMQDADIDLFLNAFGDALRATGPG